MLCKAYTGECHHCVNPCVVTAPLGGHLHSLALLYGEAEQSSLVYLC